MNQGYLVIGEKLLIQSLTVSILWYSDIIVLEPLRSDFETTFKISKLLLKPLRSDFQTHLEALFNFYKGFLSYVITIN